MLSKRLKILQVYEKGLQNRRNIFRVSRDISEKPAKRGYVDFLENCICDDKNISDLDYGSDNPSHPYTHVFGKTLMAASDIRFLH